MPRQSSNSRRLTHVTAVLKVLSVWLVKAQRRGVYADQYSVHNPSSSRPARRHSTSSALRTAEADLRNVPVPASDLQASRICRLERDDKQTRTPASHTFCDSSKDLSSSVCNATAIGSVFWWRI